ncbi:MAG: hypothetical protein RQ952_07555 [Thermoproteota archaeon]|jgi:hypothetical protein|nr:hypothetical protein [Thermoproteota archaeon]
MKLNKNFLTLFIIVLIIYSAFAYLSLTNRPAEEFFVLSMLNKEKKAGEFFPNNNSTVKINEKIVWYISIASYFRTPQVVKIVVKLGNNETLVPNSTLGTPSNGTELYDWLIYITYGETKLFYFEWEILNVKVINETYYLKLQLNQSIIVDVNQVGAFKGKNFRMIFELWTLDPTTQKFMIGWNFQRQLRIAWLQQKFNVTLEK